MPVLGVEAVLSQLQDGKETVTSCFSHRLSKAESNYCVTRRELLAVIKAFLLNFKCPDGQTARWLQELQQFSFTVEHRHGLKDNADALSIRPCLADDGKHCHRLETKERLQRGAW